MFINNLLSYLVLIPSAILCLLPMKNQMKYDTKRFGAMTGLVLALAILLGAFLQTRFGVSDNVSMIPIIIICFIAYYKSLKAPIWKSLAVFCTAIAWMSILSNISVCFHALMHHRYGFEMETYHTNLIQLCLGIVITVFLAKPYLAYGSTVIDQMNNPLVWNISFLFSIVIFIINMLLLPVGIETGRVNTNTLSLLASLILLLLLWLLMQLQFYYIVSGILAMAKTEERNRFLEMQEKQFAAQQRYMKETARTRHDFRHSLRTLTELYDAGDMEAMGKYLHQYTDSMPVNDITEYCRNTAVNAMLNFYAHVAQQNRIDFSLHVSLPDSLPISDVDLCTILGNILENAMVACQRAKERYVQLTVLTENNNQLYIVAVNSFDGKVRQKDGVYLSTGRSGNGIGLLSIISTAEIYGGIAQFSHEGSRFYSNVAIPLT